MAAGGTVHPAGYSSITARSVSSSGVFSVDHGAISEEQNLPGDEQKMINEYHGAIKNRAVDAVNPANSTKLAEFRAFRLFRAFRVKKARKI